MRNKGIILLMVLALAASAGCASKKQTVRGDGAGAGAASAGAAAGPSGTAPKGGSAGPADAIASETVRPEAGAKSGSAGGAIGGSVPASGPEGRLAMAEAQAGVAATQEKASPFQDIHFDFDQSLIRDDAKPTLGSIAAVLLKNPKTQLVIEGHCDSRGTAEYNMALGDRRAEAARKYLAALGVKASSITTVSYGKERPLVPEENEAAWARNRRDHFLVK